MIEEGLEIPAKSRDVTISPKYNPISYIHSTSGLNPSFLGPNLLMDQKFLIGH